MNCQLANLSNGLSKFWKARPITGKLFRTANKWLSISDNYWLVFERDDAHTGLTGATFAKNSND
jgi:hypothetical protein